MTKIQLPEWLDLPESSKSVIEGLDIDRYIASVTTGGKLYHKITVNGDLAKQLGVEGQKEVWVEADKVSKLDALQAAIASRTELTGKSLSLSSRRVAEVSSLLQQRWEARPVQAAVSKTVEKTTATRAEMDRKVYELRAAKVDPLTIIRDGTVAGINSIGDYNTAWRRHVRLMQQEQKGYVAPEELNRSASTQSSAMQNNPHLKKYMGGMLREMKAKGVVPIVKFVPDANGGYYTVQPQIATIGRDDGSRLEVMPNTRGSNRTVAGKTIKLSVSQNRLLINEDGRNGYRVINAMAIAKEKDSAGSRLYQSTRYSDVGKAVGNALNPTSGGWSDALKSLNITGSGIDKSSYTWLSSNLAATHSTYGQIKYTEAVPQKGSYLDLPKTGDRANYFYGKTGAVPISAIAAIPGTQVFYDKRGRFDYIKADDAAISKIIKRFGLKHQDLVNMGITPTDSIPHTKSRYASPGAAHEPQTGVRLRGGFFTTAVLAEGAGQISSKVAPYISAPFSERRDKFKIDVTQLSNEQKQSILTRLQSPLDGKAATSFLRDHDLGDGSWGNARIEGYDYDGGSHIYLKGALFKQTSDGAALKEAGIKAHLQVGSMPDDLGVDFVTNAPSSPRQFMTNVMGTLDENTLNAYWQRIHKKNAPLLGGMLRYEAARNNPNPDSPEVNISKAEQDAHNKLIDEMIPVWKLFATENTEFDKHVNQPMTEREKEAHDKAGRLVAWSPGEVNQSGERTGMATIKTDFLSVPVDVRLKADIARDRARVSAAEMRVFGELYPETSSRLRRARQGKQKYEIFNQVARYREGIPQRDMMPTFDLKEAMQDSNFRADIQERVKLLLSENPSGRLTEKQARAQALNEYEPAKGHLLKYGEAVFGQSANFAHLGFKMKDGTLKNNVGEVTDDFLDRLFQMHGANKKNIPNMFIPGNEKGKNNSFKWNPDTVADEIAKFQVAQMNNYGVRERMTDTESSMTQSHTFTSIAGMGVQEFGASAAKIAREMQIEPLDENGNVNPLYEVMLKAHEKGLITATAWRSPTPDSKTQLSIVKRAISQAEMDSRQLGVDMGDSMTNVHGKDWVYTQGADNDSDTDKTVIHTSIQKLRKPPSKEDMERAAMSEGALAYLKHENEWYGIENPYKLTDIDTVLRLAAENPADEKVGWEKKAGMGQGSLTPGATGTAFEKLLPGENRITSTEISLGSHEHAGLAGKQIGYTYDLFTKALLPLVRPEFEADAGRMAGRYYQPPLDQKPFERSSAMANMLEFISTYRLDGGKSKGNLATIDQSKGRAKFRRQIENEYNLTFPVANANGTLSFNSKDAFGNTVNDTVTDFIRKHASGVTKEQIQAIIASKQKVYKMDKEGNLVFDKQGNKIIDSGNFRYTFKPDMLRDPAKRVDTGAFADAKAIERIMTTQFGNFGSDGNITQGIYTGYSDDGKTDYAQLHQWLEDLDKEPNPYLNQIEGLNTVDALLGRDKGRLDKTFRDALFSRTDIANQDQMESVNPIETMLEFMSQIGKGDETVSRELASVMIPGNLAQPQLPLEEIRNRIAQTIQDNKADGGGLLNLLDSFSEGGRYDQSDSPLGIATKGITYMNMHKDILDETRTLQASWTRQQEKKREQIVADGGRWYPINDVSADEFYQTHIEPSLKSGKVPLFLNELPNYLKEQNYGKILSRYTNLNQNAGDYQSSYENLSDSVHAMSLGEQSTHKSWQSLSKFLRNRHLQEKGLVNREVDWKDVNYREMFAESPKPIELQVNPHFLDEEGVNSHQPTDDDEEWARQQAVNPNDYGEAPTQSQYGIRERSLAIKEIMGQIYGQANEGVSYTVGRRSELDGETEINKFEYMKNNGYGGLYSPKEQGIFIDIDNIKDPLKVLHHELTHHNESKVLNDDTKEQLRAAALPHKDMYEAFLQKHRGMSTEDAKRKTESYYLQPNEILARYSQSAIVGGREDFNTLGKTELLQSMVNTMFGADRDSFILANRKKLSAIVDPIVRSSDPADFERAKKEVAAIMSAFNSPKPELGDMVDKPEPRDVLYGMPEEVRARSLALKSIMGSIWGEGNNDVGYLVANRDELPSKTVSFNGMSRNILDNGVASQLFPNMFVGGGSSYRNKNWRGVYTTHRLYDEDGNEINDTAKSFIGVNREVNESLFGTATHELTHHLQKRVLTDNLKTDLEYLPYHEDYDGMVQAFMNDGKSYEDAEKAVYRSFLTANELHAYAAQGIVEGKKNGLVTDEVEAMTRPLTEKMFGADRVRFVEQNRDALRAIVDPLLHSNDLEQMERAKEQVAAIMSGLNSPKQAETKPNLDDVLAQIGANKPDKWSKPSVSEWGQSSPISLPTREQWETNGRFFERVGTGKAKQIKKSMVDPSLLRKPVTTLADTDLAPIPIPERVDPEIVSMAIPKQDDSKYLPTKWEEPLRMDRKGSLTASDMINPGRTMLLNMLEKGGHFKGKSVDSVLSNRIKDEVSRLLKGEYDNVGIRSAKVNGVDLSGSLDLVRQRDGVSEIIDLTTSTASNDLYGKIEETGLRTIAKAHILSKQEGFENDTIKARMVALSDANQARLKAHKRDIANGGQIDNDFIKEMALDLANQVKSGGYKETYNPAINDRSLYEGIDAALARQSQARGIYDSVKGSVNGIVAPLFGERFNLIPKFARGGMIFGGSKVSQLNYSRKAYKPVIGGSYQPLDTKGKLTLAAYYAATKVTSAAEAMNTFVPDWVNPLFAHGGKPDSKNYIWGEDGKEMMIALNKLQSHGDGVMSFDLSQADTASTARLDSKSNVAIVPIGKAQIAGGKAFFFQDNLGEVNDVKPSFDKHQDGAIIPSMDNSGRFWHEGREMFQDPNTGEYQYAMRSAKPQQPSQVDQQAIAKALVGNVAPNATPVANLQRMSAPQFPTKEMLPIPSMVADIERLATLPSHLGAMSRDYRIMQGGGTPETPNKQYAQTLSVASKYWDRLGGIEKKAQAILTRYQHEEGLRTNPAMAGVYRNFAEQAQNATPDNYPSSAMIATMGADLNLDPAQSKAYFKAVRTQPFAPTEGRVAGAKQIMAAIGKVKASFGQVQPSKINELLGQDLYQTGGEAISGLSAYMHGQFTNSKEQMAFRDSQVKADEESLRVQEKEKLSIRMARTNYASVNDRIAAEGRGREEGKEDADRIGSRLQSSIQDRASALQSFKEQQQALRMAKATGDRDGVNQALQGMTSSAASVERLNNEIDLYASAIGNAKKQHKENSIAISDLSSQISSFGEVVKLTGSGQKKLAEMTAQRTGLLERQAYLEQTMAIPTKGATHKTASTDSAIVAAERMNRSVELESLKQEAKLNTRAKKDELDKANAALSMATARERAEANYPVSSLKEHREMVLGQGLKQATANESIARTMEEAQAKLNLAVGADKAKMMGEGQSKLDKATAKGTKLDSQLLTGQYNSAAAREQALFDLDNQVMTEMQGKMKAAMEKKRTGLESEYKQAVASQASQERINELGQKLQAATQMERVAIEGGLAGQYKKAVGEQKKDDTHLAQAQLKAATAQEAYQRSLDKEGYLQLKEAHGNVFDRDLKKQSALGKRDAQGAMSLQSSADVSRYMQLTNEQRRDSREWIQRQQAAIANPSDLANIQAADKIRARMGERNAERSQLFPHIKDEVAAIKQSLSEAKANEREAKATYGKAYSNLSKEHQAKLDRGEQVDFTDFQGGAFKQAQQGYLGARRNVAMLEQQMKLVATPSSQPTPPKLANDAAVQQAIADQKLTDKRDKLDSAYQFKKDVSAARQSGSTLGSQMGLHADAQTLSGRNATAQSAKAAWQQAHEAFNTGGGYDKPIQEWSSATRNAAHEMDRNAKIVRDLNVGNVSLVEATQQHVQTLKSSNETSKQSIDALKVSAKYHADQMKTFEVDKTGQDYLRHDAKRAIAENDIKAETRKIGERQARIAKHEEVLGEQVGDLRSVGAEKKIGKRGIMGNAIGNMFDMQNMFYASSSLANYGYMVGSPLLQARSGYIQEEYNRSKISAMMSPTGKSERTEMTAIRQQQSAFEDAYSQFAKGVYKQLSPVYKMIGQMTGEGNDSNTLEMLGRAAPISVGALTAGVVGKVATPITRGMMAMGGMEGSALGYAAPITFAAMSAAALLPGAYNMAVRGDNMSVMGIDTGYGANAGIVGKGANRFDEKVWNNLGQIDYAARVFKNTITSPFDNRSNTNTSAAIENMAAGWYAGDMANQNLTPEQAQQARENLNNQQVERGFGLQASEFVAKSALGFGAMQVENLKVGLGYSNKTKADIDKEFGEYISGAWESKRDFTYESPTSLPTRRDDIASRYDRSDPNQEMAYQQELSNYDKLSKKMGGDDNVDLEITRVQDMSNRPTPDGGKPMPLLSESDTGRMVANLMDTTGMTKDNPMYDIVAKSMIAQIEKGNNLDETLPEVKRAADLAPFKPGAVTNAAFVSLLTKPNEKGEAASDVERQARTEFMGNFASPMDALGLAGDTKAVDAAYNKYSKIWAEKGEREMKNQWARDTGLTSGDMISRTPYFWSSKARDAANDMSIAANSDPLMSEATRSLQLVDDKGRGMGFFEKRAAQDKDTRFKNEMELGAQYKDVTYIDPLDGEKRTRQEITGFSGGEMQRKLDSMLRDVTITFGTMADIATKFGQSETYTADGEGARWKDNRREKYGLDMTGYSDNLVSKMDYQYTMQTKGHDMQMKNYELQLDQIDLNLKKQKESFEMSKDFGEKQKAIQLELFNLETKYKYEDLEIAKGKAAKQYGRQMEDFATQRARLNVSHGWKMDDFNTQEYRTEVGRSWQLQDNAMNREQFDLQTGWQSEDAERNIRYATGRQRIDLKRNYERQNIMNQLKLDQMYQGEQRQQIQYGWNMSDIDKGRNRENTQNDWANADITKGENRAGEDFATAIADIDRAKARLDETIPLQRQLIELSNEYWKLQMDFQSKYMKEEEAMAKRQKEQITEKMALEQWQFEQQMGWFEIDRKYQEEKAAKDIDIFTRQKAHSEDMVRIQENLLRIQREEEVAQIAFNTQMHIGYLETSKMYPAMNSMMESTVKMSVGTKQAADNFVTMNNRALTFNMTLEKSVALMAQLGNGTAGDLLPPPVLSGNISTPVAPTIPPHTIGHFNGGYTGNAPITTPAGIVHGQEYVIPHQGSPVLREPQVVNLLSSILTALQNTGGTQVVLDGEVISRVVDRTVGGHFANAMGNWDRS